MDKKNKESFQHNDEYCGGCGCGVDCNDDHDHEFEDIEDYGTIHLTLDDDTELDCAVLGIFEVEDEEYIALLPEGEEEVLLYRFIEHDDEDFDLLPIEDEEEFGLVSEAFQVLFLDEEDEAYLLDDEEFVEYDSYEELED